MILNNSKHTFLKNLKLEKLFLFHEDSFKSLQRNEEESKNVITRFSIFFNIE